MSIGTPTKQAPSPSAVAWAGSRIIVAGPAKRGISLPPSGWLNIVAPFLSADLGEELAEAVRLLLLEHRLGRSLFLDLALVQEDDFGRDVARKAHFMGD